MPPPDDPTCLLARHEAAIFTEARDLLQELGGDHRSELANRHILPICRNLIEAMGHRAAYESAKRAEVNPDLLALYKAGAIKKDSAWYVEQAGLTRRMQNEMEDRAVTSLLPRLEPLLEATGAEPYCVAPIVSDDRWHQFVNSLEELSGDAVVDALRADA